MQKSTSQPTASLANLLASLPREQRARIAAALSPAEQRELEFLWEFWARPNQLDPNTDWRTWLLLAGRGFGKTRCGAEWVRKRARINPASRIALVGPTAADVRDVMIEGESGLLAICPPQQRPLYEPSKPH